MLTRRPAQPGTRRAGGVAAPTLVTGLLLTTLVGCSSPPPSGPASRAATSDASSGPGPGPGSTPASGSTSPATENPRGPGGSRVTGSPGATPNASGPAVPGTPSPTSAPVVPPPYVAGVRWVTHASGRSLQVRPTRAGRVTTATDAGAWAEVLRLAPGADTPGMRAQFSCHWTFARALAPDKPTWNLEPWRPVVTPDEMVTAGCNPGGQQE